MPTTAAGAGARGPKGNTMTGTQTGARRRTTKLAGAGTEDQREIRMVAEGQTGARGRSVAFAGAG